MAGIPVRVNISYSSLDGGAFRVSAPGFPTGRPHLSRGQAGPARDTLEFALTTPEGVTEITLWVPEQQFSASREVRFDKTDDWKKQLTMKQNCPDGTYPFAVHIKVIKDFIEKVGPLHIPGNQLADGNSHPACEVGP